MKSGIIIICLFIISKTYCQNLFPDPGFENINMVKNGDNYNFEYLQWSNVTPPDRVNGIGLPKYSLYLKKSESSTLDPHLNLTKETINNWYKPHSGDSYFELQYPFFPNLNEATLNQILQKDSVYYFQMYIKVFANNYGKYNFNSGLVGLWFTNHDFTDSIGEKLMHKNKLKIKPHIQVTDFKIKDNEKWVKFTASFKSDDNYSKVLIGNFAPLMPQVPEMYTKREGLSYNLDDLCLVPIWNKSICDSKELGEIFELRNIYFDLNSFQISQEGKKELLDLAMFFKNKKTKMELKGYADSTGNEINNKELSENRAKAVYDVLLDLGITDSRMSFTGEGSSNPLDTNLSETGRKLNRRVEIKLEEE